MKIGFLGFSKEGQEMYTYLKNKNFYKNSNFLIFDKNKDLKTPKSIKVFLGDDYLDSLEKEDCDIVFRSPGIHYEKVRHIKNITSMTKYFMSHCKGKVIGITGTKGKGTTSSLVYLALKKILKKDQKVFMMGNMGLPSIKYLDKIKNSDYVVYELSSFQLQDLEISPYLAIVTEIFPDHMDIHKNYEEYIYSKSNITKYQNKNSLAITFSHNEDSKKIVNLSKGRKVFIDVDNFSKFQEKDLNIRGYHNYKNAILAYKSIELLGFIEKEDDSKKVIKSILNFKGNPHRLELVYNENNIQVFNDSSSTNPETTLAAYNSFPKIPKILIVGGADKGLNYDLWKDNFNNGEMKLLVILGSNKYKIIKSLGKCNYNFIEVNSLSDAKEVILKVLQPNDIVILSPGSTSFDMFKNYVERGDIFRKLWQK